MTKLNEKQIKSYMDKLEITRDEAIELVKFDLEETDNEEVAEIEAKITATKQAVKDSKPSPIAKVKTLKAKKKEDAEKDALIDAMTAFIKNSGLTFEPQDMRANKIAFKGESGVIYSIALTKHRGAVDGYKGNPK